MKNSYLFALLGLFSVSFIYSQSNKSENCIRTCEKTLIVKEGPFLGVKIITRSNKKGTEILEIVPNTSAVEEGLKKGDFFIKFDNVEVVDQYHFVNLIKEHKPDDVVKLIFIREGVQIVQDVTIGAISTKVIKKMVCCDEEDQDEFEKSVTLFPIPTNNKITIESNFVSGEYTVQIYNSAGILLNNIKDSAKQNFSKTILVNTFPDGNYIIRLENKGKVITRNFLIKR